MWFQPPKLESMGFTMVQTTSKSAKRHSQMSSFLDHLTRSVLFWSWDHGEATLVFSANMFVGMVGIV